MEQEINYCKIIIAREYNKLTQSQFLKELNDRFSIKLSQSELSKIERGERKAISEELLDAFCEVLKFPKSYFYTEGEIIDVKLSLFRKRKRLTKKIQSYILGTVNVFDDACRFLLDSSKELNIDVPLMPLDKYDSPQEIARALRIYWRVPSGPINNLTNLLEDKGIIINLIDAETDNFDGYSHSKNGLYYITLNNNMPGDRLRFTLAHELGHMIMRNEALPHDIAEKTSNQFAAEFLMPETEILYKLKNISIEKAIYLKPYWKVSIAAIIRRAYDLNVINKSRYYSLNSYLSKLGYKKNEPVIIEKEIPTLFKEIIQAYIEDDEFTIEQIATKANLTKSVLMNIHRPERNKLSVV